MKSKASRDGGTAATQAERAILPAERGWSAALALAGFVLLATGVFVRSLLGEMPDYQVTDLIGLPQDRWSASAFATYAAHLVTAAGLAVCVLWAAVGRRSWRWSGLEAGAVGLIYAAAISFSIASEKRLAITAGIDMILPMLAAAGLYQLMRQDARWQRAVLAVLIATAAGQCWKATAQVNWEYERAWEDYQQNKAGFWLQQGVRLDDPAVKLYEANHMPRKPEGYFRHSNVLGSFLLLGLGGAGAALAGSRWRGGARPAALVAAIVLAGLVAWLLIVLGWVHSIGATVGLAAGIATAGGAWAFRERPGRQAILLIVGFVLLQGTLTGLGLRASSLYAPLAERRDKAWSFAVRFAFWEGAARIFADHPLAGVGPGQYRRHYNMIKEVNVPLEPSHPHNWILCTAAEYGSLGVLGTLVALGATGWVILRSPTRREDETERARPIERAMVPAILAVLGCWLVVGTDLPEKGWSSAIVSLGVGLGAMTAAGLSGTGGRLGRVLLLAALVAFVVHGTVEMTSGVAGVMGPFWVVVALAMAWGTSAKAAAEGSRLSPGWQGYAGMTLAGLATCAAAGFSILPLRAGLLMREAQGMMESGQPEETVRLLREAGAVDRLDPNPLSAAGMLRSRMASQDGSREVSHMREAVELYEAAAQRDPLRHLLWRNLASGTMRLARRLGDAAGMRRAVELKRKEAALYPNNLLVWYELSRMAATAGTLPQGDQPEMLRLALECLEKTRVLEEGWISRDFRTFDARQQAQMEQMREDLVRRLGGGGDAAWPGGLIRILVESRAADEHGPAAGPAIYVSGKVVRPAAGPWHPKPGAQCSTIDRMIRFLIEPCAGDRHPAREWVPVDGWCGRKQRGHCTSGRVSGESPKRGRFYCSDSQL